MFNKNIESIDNIALKRRLNRLSAEESRIGISYCVTPSNDYVLLKNDIPTDDLTNPREAIKKHLESTIKNEMRSNDIIIVFGMGLGYLLDEVYNKYSSRILVYEPDLELLHFVLNNVEMSEILSSGRVFITNDIDELLNKLGTIFITKDRVEIVYLQNYAITKNKELLLLTQKVFDVCKSKMVDVNTIAKFSKAWLLNTVYNITRVNEQSVYLLSDLKGRFVGQSALIVGAGPSLMDNIEKIKSNRNRFVIFAVNKVLKYLIQNGIVPDFLVCLDANNIDTTLEGCEDYFSQICCIMDIRTDKSVLEKGFKKVLLNFSNTDFFIKKLAKYNPKMRFIESGGSASTLALSAAVKLGFSKVILSGLDLAFRDNQIYSNGTAMQRISQNEIIVDNVKKVLVQVKSVTGEMVYTREDYEAFIHHFATLIKQLEYSEIYNTTTFGAYIPGTKNAGFDELIPFSETSFSMLELLEPYKFEMQQFIQDEFQSINEIITMLSKGVFSPALVSAVVKSVLVYQYLQSDVLTVLQKNFDSELANDFVNNTKVAIKNIVELLQKSKLI